MFEEIAAEKRLFSRYCPVTKKDPRESLLSSFVVVSMDSQSQIRRSIPRCTPIELFPDLHSECHAHEPFFSSKQQKRPALAFICTVGSILAFWENIHSKYSNRRSFCPSPSSSSGYVFHSQTIERRERSPLSK